MRFLTGLTNSIVELLSEDRFGQLVKFGDPPHSRRLRVPQAARRSFWSCRRENSVVAEQNRSEAVMLINIPAGCARDLIGSRKRTPCELSTRILVGMRVVIAVGLSVCLGWASPAIGQNVATRAPLLPFPDEANVAPTKATVANQNTATVIFRNGQLTIDARNSTLAEVLKLVAETGGATIDVPIGTGLDRIFVDHDGPGPVQDVLARLLNGSGYDFIIAGSPAGVSGPAQVLLSLHRPDEPAASQPQGSNPVPVSSFLSTPPEVTSAPPPFSPLPIDPASLPPKEKLTPEALGKLMRDRAEELRDDLKKQQP